MPHRVYGEENKIMLYTVGYNNFSFFEFRDKIKSLGVIIIDIRYSPNSYSTFWNKQYLEDIFGNSYIHLPELGNKNYKNPEKEFDIVDIEAGANKVIEYMDLGFNCILLCACGDVDKCHRKLVAEKIKEKSNCEIIHI